MAASAGDKVKTAPESIEWVDEQIAVITVPADGRTLVSAGPGTGKTAVTCARIAHLINEFDVEPSKIWLVSFTRTAVHELRQRIFHFLGDSGKTAGIRIATIDSHAWSIQSGFDATASITGTYEENIRRVIELIKSHEGVFEYLSGVKHVFVDEAQDVIGIRCELILELINALPADCGVTVLADEAQSIYGFSEDEVPAAVQGTLPDRIREFLKFKELHLTQIHRTDDPILIELFGKGRGIILKGAVRGNARLEQIREFLTGTSHGDAGQYRDDMKSLPADIQDAFLLFRKRGEALEASSYLDARPHRLRISGLPVAVHEWIALVLWDWKSGEMNKEEFQSRWAKRVKSERISCEAAWGVLVRICGLTERTISTERLAVRLGHGSPPVELCDPDFGSAGPVVGTIHGAKGREAGEVRLYLPSPGKVEDSAAEEEARVLFVGATRARYKLHVGRGQSKVSARRAQSGRAFTPYAYGGKARACVEVGRQEDVDALGLAGRAFFASEAEVRKAQLSIEGMNERIEKASAVAGPKTITYRYGVQCGGSLLCYLSNRVNNDMFEIARVIDSFVHMNRLKPPRDIPYLRIFGARTIALAPEDPTREKLHSPWRDSGFLLAPLVIGYGMVYFWY